MIMKPFIFKPIDVKRENKKATIAVYLILRTLVIICMGLQFVRGDLNNAMLCLLSLILLVIPSFVQKKFSITLPSPLEITLYLFIFSAEILGEINSFYIVIPYWDIILHTINGFLATAVGLSLVDLLNNNSDEFKLSPIYLCIVAFCFSMTVGVMWELLEYGLDKTIKTDMQKDTVISEIYTVNLDDTKCNIPIAVEDIDKTIVLNKYGQEIAVFEDGYLDIGLNDTMEDLFVNFIGATIFCIFAYNCLLDKNKKRRFDVVKFFVPTRRKNNSMINK